MMFEEINDERRTTTEAGHPKIRKAPSAQVSYKQPITHEFEFYFN
jgi:hypothetical protein